MPDHISSQQNGGQQWASDQVSECVCLCGQTMNGMPAAATEGFLPVYDALGSCSISEQTCSKEGKVCLYVITSQLPCQQDPTYTGVVGKLESCFTS